MTRLRSHLLLAALLVTLVFGLASADAAVAPGRVLLTAREFTLGLSRTTVRVPASGPDRHLTIMQFRNGGEDPHDLRVRRLDSHGRPYGTGWRFPEIRSGTMVERELHLRPGRYRLVCTLPGHERLGMRATLLVR